MDATEVWIANPCRDESSASSSCEGAGRKGYDMTHAELLEAMARAKKGVVLGEDPPDEKETRQRKMIRDFWFSTGVTMKFFQSMPEEDAMECWAKFVIERMEDLS